MLVAAIISVCLANAPTSCERHSIKIEERACRIGPMKAEIDLNGIPTPAVARIECEGKR